MSEGTSSGDPFYLQWTICRGGDTSVSESVSYRLLSGTAQAGSDVYSYFSGTAVTFVAGETSKTVSFRVDADDENEPDQSAVLEVYAVSGATLAGGSPVLRARRRRRHAALAFRVAPDPDRGRRGQQDRKLRAVAVASRHAGL